MRIPTVGLLLGSLIVLGGLIGLAPAAHADGVALTKGDVLAGIGNGMIAHYSPTGVLLDTLNTGQPGTEDTGMCFDGSTNLYSTEFEANTMSKFDSGGNLLSSFGSGFNAHPESCVVDKSGNIYVGQADGSANILKFDANGNLLATYAPATGQNRGTDWIDLAADQCTMQYAGEGSIIGAFNVCTNTQLPDFATGLPAPCFAHRILSGGGELVACESEVVRLDSTGAVVQTYNPAPGGYLFAMNVDPDGTSFWTADINTGQIWHIDMASGTVLTTFTAPVNQSLAGLAVVGEITVGGGGTPTPTSLAVNSGTGDYADATTVLAVLTNANTHAPISGQSVTFTLNGAESCSGTTDATGTASCPITPGEAAGTYTLAGSFAGNSTYGSSSGSNSFGVTLEQTALSYTGATSVINGNSLAVSGVLTTDDPTNGTALAGKPVTFTLGSGTTAQSCPATTDSTGTASCTISGVNQTVGTVPVAANFAGDTHYLAASASSNVSVFAPTALGAFVIGDISSGSPTMGKAVDFWDAQWAKANKLSGGPAPSAMKGFADNPTALSCGSKWTTSTGNSSAPPATLPGNIQVIVSSSVRQNGSVISGTIVHIVLVHVAPGYGPAPGHMGTGTIVSTIC